ARQGLAFRLRIAAFVPAALTAAIATRTALVPALRWIAHRLPALRRVTDRLAGLAGIDIDHLVAGLALALAIARQLPDRLDGEVVTHPALVAAAQALVGRVPAGATLVVPERPIAFLVPRYTRATAPIPP